MKKLTVLLFAAGSLAFFDSQFWPLDQAEKTWGVSPFSPDKFKTEASAARAPMALDLIKRGLYIGEKFQRVEKALGKSDIQFDGHRYPAYRIGGDKTDLGILIFLPDYTGQRVEEVRIAKTESPKPTNATSVGPKLLPIEIQGDSAKAIFEQMTAIKEGPTGKIGKSILCQRSPQYHCAFVVDSEGQATSR